MIFSKGWKMKVGRASRLPVSECKRDACKPFCGEFSNAWKSKSAGSAWLPLRCRRCAPASLRVQGLEGFAILDVEVGWRLKI